MRDYRQSLVLFVVVFASLALVCLNALPGRASPAGALAAGSPVHRSSSTPDCLIERDQATYSQAGQGLIITPLDQYDEDDGLLWLTTWSVSGEPGRAVEVQVLVFHCLGDIASLTYCAPDRAAYTSTHTVLVVVPSSGATAFAVSEPVLSCCEFAQADLAVVNGQPWGASYFDRKANAPWCLVTPVATSTPTLPTATPDGHASGTPTASATATATASAVATTTPTATPDDSGPATATATATPDGGVTGTATPTATPDDGSTGTATATATPTATPDDGSVGTATATPTATPDDGGAHTTTVTPTMLASATPTRTPEQAPSRLQWYFPLIHKDDMPVF